MLRSNCSGTDWRTTDQGIQHHTEDGSDILEGSLKQRCKHLTETSPDDLQNIGDVLEIKVQTVDALGQPVTEAFHLGNDVVPDAGNSGVELDSVHAKTMDAEEALMKAIVDDLAETYHCHVDATSPDEKMFNLQCLTDEYFDYEMTGIVYDYNNLKNLIVVFGVKASSEVSGS